MEPGMEDTIRKEFSAKYPFYDHLSITHSSIQSSYYISSFERPAFHPQFPE